MAEVGLSIHGIHSSCRPGMPMMPKFVVTVGRFEATIAGCVVLFNDNLEACLKRQACAGIFNDRLSASLCLWHQL